MRSKFVMRLLAVGASAVAVLGGGSFALAADSAVPATGNVYSGCVRSLGHALYNVRVNSTPRCFRGDTLITWNQNGPKGDKGDKGDKGVPTLNIGCDSGTPIGGGFTVAEPVIGVYTDEDRPQPDTGTPSTWEVSVASTAGLDLTMTVYVVCATPVGSSAAAAGQAQRAQGAHIVSRTVQAIKNAKS